MDSDSESIRHFAVGGAAAEMVLYGILSFQLAAQSYRAMVAAAGGDSDGERGQADAFGRGVEVAGGGSTKAGRQHSIWQGYRAQRAGPAETSYARSDATAAGDCGVRYGREHRPVPGHRREDALFTISVVRRGRSRQDIGGRSHQG